MNPEDKEALELEGRRLRSGKVTSVDSDSTMATHGNGSSRTTPGRDALGDSGGDSENTPRNEIENASFQTEKEDNITLKHQELNRKANSREGSPISSRKRRELEAKALLVELQMREVALQRSLAEARYELSKMPPYENSDTATLGPAHSASPSRGGAGHEKERDSETDVRERFQERGRPRDTKTEDLTLALADALRFLKTESGKSSTPPPPKYLHELPIFNGDISEWIAFKTVYMDTKRLFNETQNIARLRKALRGNAKEAVKALLYSGAYTEEVMESLERRFGRPEILILNELDNVKKMPRLQEDGKNIASFASRITNCVATIKALKKPQYLYSPELTNRIVEKLNMIIKFKWYEYSARYPEEPDLVRMSDFLTEISEQCGAMAAYETRKEEKRQTRYSDRKKPIHMTREYESDEQMYNSDSDSESEYEEPRKLVAAVGKTEERPLKKKFEKRKASPTRPSTTASKQIICALCEKEHALKDCERFKALSVDERWEKAKEAKMCFRCLTYTHRRFTCRAKPCGKDGCRWGHHRLLHQEEEVKGSVASSVNAVKGEHTTYLKIVPVELYGPKGKKETFALLDEGSTITLIEEATALAVVPKGKAEPLNIEGIGGKRTDFEQSFKLSIKVKGRFERKMESMTAYTMGPLNITTQTVTREVVSKCEHLKEIEDQLIYERARPTILIGQDNWHLISSREIIEGDVDQPVASYTSLGWVLHGREKGRNRGLVHFVSMEKKENAVDIMVKEHFSLENLGIEAKKPSNDIEKRALTVLDNTTKQLPSGRYEAGLLWKTDQEIMPDNRQHAERRLHSIEKKLEKDCELKKEYSKQIQNLFEKEYAEQVTEEPTSPRTWYLPHFAVRHPQKGKIRLVFDAAARVGGRSLNDALLPGPDLLQSLFGVLARFREGRVAVIADIKEMFLQIKIREEDRDSLRFLWRDKRDEPVKEYRMTSLIFGAASSPCTAIYVKNKNAERFKDTYPETTQAVERHFYMDDYLQAFESAEKARKAIKEMMAIHSEAKFELRGWASNSAEAIEGIEEKQEAPNTASLGDKEERTLGMIWKINNDTLSFALNLRNTPRETIDGERPPTKREVTSAVMSVFDPLGLASPVTVQGKKLIQNIWRSGIDWDTKISKELEKEWKKWLDDLALLEGLEVPRSITPQPNKGEMHVFVDASEQAYASAVYWLDEKTREVSLIAAKARVTPLKPISVPRLELQAAVMGCRLAESLKKEINSTVTTTTYWSDSRTVLAWIKADPRQFKPFVAHRLAEIEEKSTPPQWRWIPTKINVADDATRETPKDFSATHRWFVGPEFLRQDKSEWPKTKDENAPIDESEKKQAHVHTTTTVKPKNDPLPAVERFSKWGRYIRATARVVQCVEVLRKRYEPQDTERRNQILPLNIKYIKMAEHLILQRAQREDFAEEIVRTKAKQPMPKISKLRKLCLEVDKNEILRVTGRLDLYQNLDGSSKRPAVLHAKNAITQRLIQHTHETFMHGNHETVINELRQKYYIVGMRNAVRKLIHKCQWCRLRKLKPTRPDEGMLPPERLNSHAPPFNCSAIDYFGPMIVTAGRRREKRWGALITCLTTRAIHIELAPSVTPSSAIMVLRRFMARRGTPSIMYSDNGSNFVKANKELQEAANEVSKYATARGIVWKFIPPGAPHMGGAWERMIRTVKTSLAAVLKEKAPREEILHTLLLEVEHVVNSHPLTPVQPDLEKEAITPNHFLIGRSCGITPIGNFNTQDADSHTWKATQQLANQFWQRWVKEYLPLLLPKQIASSQHHDEPRIGDIVLISDGTLPRGLWPRGEVTDILPGPDNKIRVVEVRTNTGILRRPTSRLVILARPNQTAPHSETTPDCNGSLQDPRSHDNSSTPPSDSVLAHKGENVGDRSPYPTASDEEYSVYLGRWTSCSAAGEHAARVKQRAEADSLVHTPRLGLQWRQIQCRAKDGRIVEPRYCGAEMDQTVWTRVCVIEEDCQLAEWLPWRPRSDGALVRTRRLKRLPQGGGKECDVVEEVRPAALEASAHWVPGSWGECQVAVEQTITPLPANDDDSDDAIANDAIYEDDDDLDDITDKSSGASCGGGVQRREATCVRADGRLLHPVQCAHAPMPTLVQPCEIPCPRDCEVGEWSEWGACQPADGCPLYPVQQLTSTGYSVRSRRVISAASGGGAPCPPLEEKRTCSTPRCASWKALPWGPCVLNQPHSTCGPGRRSRELLCLGHDGKDAQRAWCAGTSAPARTERCRIACAGDCVVSSWGPWSPCSATCAGQHQRPFATRRRHILAHASPTGWPCPSEEQLIQNETCNTHACATYSWLVTPWGPCQRRSQDYVPNNNYTDLTDTDTFNDSDEEEPCIEEGEMSRDVMCVQNNADVVRENLCAPLKRPSPRRACTVRCRRGCRVEAWGPWSPCPNTCDPGKQVRMRKVFGGPNCGALQESRDCPAARSCRAREATWVTGEWGVCRLMPDRQCGRGYRVRSIWCGSDSHRVEAGACAGQLVPRSVASCHVSCDYALTPITCDTVCAEPLKYLDAAEPDVPTCICKNVTLELLPADSDCILPPGLECGEGRALRAARCMVASRDVPMDVCKKFHPLTGPNRVREASTDGYSYDEEFPSLLRGACSVRCARDCAAGAWGEWGPCAVEPGSRAAFRFRTREVIEEGSAGGRECGATLQRATCLLREPRWQTGEWSVCAPQRALCGRATINRTVTCVDSKGKKLEESACAQGGAGPRPAREAACRAPCPADCVVSAWSEWSPCEQTKWGGRRDRTRVVLRPAEVGGADCPHLVAAEPCAPHTYSWHVAPWDDCQPLGGSPCGEGIKKRSVRCLRSDGVFVNDSFCPNATASEASESWCYVPCGVDCVLGEWSAWDSSACFCGDVSSTKHMRRSRQHLTAAVWPGRACPPTEQRAPCPREPCLRLVARPMLGCHVQSVSGDIAEGACGWGVQVSHARCELSSGDEQEAYLEPWRCATVLPGRIVAPPSHYQEEEECKVECGCKESESGQPGPWGAWGPCRGGARSRTRQLLVPMRQACRTSSRYVTIEWANCTSDHDALPKIMYVDSKDRQRTNWMYADNDESRTSVLVMTWTSTIIIALYTVYVTYRGVLRCLRSRKLKTITKV